MQHKKVIPRRQIAFLSETELLPVYLKEIGKHQPLSSKEEAGLAVQIRCGNRMALEKLVLANLRFVVSVSRNYENQGLPLSDLINEGNLGLIRAAERFDERKNFRFISYAVWWIRQGILQALAEKSRIVRLPLNRVGTIHRIGKAQSRLSQVYQRMPNLEEVAREMNVSENEVRMMMKVGNRHASLDAPLLENGNSNLGDMLHNEEDEEGQKECAAHLSLREEISRTLDKLPGREQEIVRLYFGIGEETAHTLDEIGRRFALTRERIRQIKERALRRLRQPAANSGLRLFY